MHGDIMNRFHYICSFLRHFTRKPELLLSIIKITNWLTITITYYGFSFLFTLSSKLEVHRKFWNCVKRADVCFFRPTTSVRATIRSTLPPSDWGRSLHVFRLFSEFPISSWYRYYYSSGSVDGNLLPYVASLPIFSFVLSNALRKLNIRAAPMMYICCRLKLYVNFLYPSE